MIMMGFVVASLFFARFYRDTRDRIFLLFAVSFALLGIERFVFVWSGARDRTETTPEIYLFRCVAFLLIILAVLGKNAGAKDP
jgi:hypothetical protein